MVNASRLTPSSSGACGQTATPGRGDWRSSHRARKHRRPHVSCSAIVRRDGATDAAVLDRHATGRAAPELEDTRAAGSAPRESGLSAPRGTSRGSPRRDGLRCSGDTVGLIPGTRRDGEAKATGHTRSLPGDPGRAAGCLDRRRLTPSSSGAGGQTALPGHGDWRPSHRARKHRRPHVACSALVRRAGATGAAVLSRQDTGRAAPELETHARPGAPPEDVF
jgi:hypothetical protein